MRTLDHLHGMRRTFSTNRARAALTLLGIVIGTGSIVMLAGLLEGAEGALVKLNQGVNESDTIRIDKDDPPEKQRDRVQRPLSRDDSVALDGSAQLPGMDVVTERRHEGIARQGGREKRVRLVGAAPGALELYRLGVARGRSIDARDLEEGRRVAVVGHEIWKELLEEDPEPLGKQLRVDDQSWTIIGVLAHKPTMGHGTGTWMWDRKILVPETAFDAVLSPDHQISAIFIRTASERPRVGWAEEVSRFAEEILLRRHLGVKNFRFADRKGSSQERLIMTIIEVLLLGTGVMSLFVGGINIMNIMLVTVTERTREIGIRRAIGASPREILVQFVLEAATVSLVGGVLGVLGGIATCWLVGLGLGHLFGEWTFHVEPWSVAVGLGLALATGVAFGYFPARRAAGLNPVEALRYE